MAIELTINANHLFWYSNNKIHNKYSPAIKWDNGTKVWCMYNMYHRLDGPAIEWPNGTKEWYINDIKHTYLEYLNAREQLNSSKENV